MAAPDPAPWTAARVVAEVERAWGEPCTSCAAATVGQEIVIGLLMGEAELRCGECLAQRHGREGDEFLDHARRSVARLDCFRAGWEAADRRLDLEVNPRWPDRLRLAESEEPMGQDPDPEGTGDIEIADHFDAGDLGCGELVLKLRGRLNALGQGECLRLTARDPGAPEDLPAWCGLTGHRLVSADHPTYIIARRPDPAPSDT